jgi:hypothetical protein
MVITDAFGEETTHELAGGSVLPSGALRLSKETGEELCYAPWAWKSYRAVSVEGE